MAINGQEQFAEFVQRLAHLNLAVPGERLQPLFVEYVELRRLIGVMEQKVVACEPANTFSVLGTPSVESA